MSTPAWSVRRLQAVDAAQLDELADVLVDCVEGGASVSFMHPLTRDRALAFWRRVARAVAAGERALLVAEDAIRHDKDLEVAAVLFTFGRTEIERWSGYPILHGQFVWAECRACERRYTPEECAASDWSKVADPRAGIGGSCLACPGGHVIFARQTWVA